MTAETATDGLDALMHAVSAYGEISPVITRVHREAYEHVRREAVLYGLRVLAGQECRRLPSNWEFSAPEDECEGRIAYAIRHAWMETPRLAAVFPERCVPCKARMATYRGGWVKSAAPRVRTHCKHGHPWTPENVYQRRRDGATMCRACRAAFERRRRRGQTVGRWWEDRLGRGQWPLAEGEALTGACSWWVHGRG